MLVRGVQVEGLSLESLGQTDQVRSDELAADSRAPVLDEDDLADQITMAQLGAEPVSPEVEALDTNRARGVGLA